MNANPLKTRQAKLQQLRLAKSLAQQARKSQSSTLIKPPSAPKPDQSHHQTDPLITQLKKHRSDLFSNKKKSVAISVNLQTTKLKKEYLLQQLSKINQKQLQQPQIPFQNSFFSDLKHKIQTAQHQKTQLKFQTQKLIQDHQIFKSRASLAKQRLQADRKSLQNIQKESNSQNQQKILSQIYQQRQEIKNHIRNARQHLENQITLLYQKQELLESQQRSWCQLLEQHTCLSQALIAPHLHQSLPADPPPQDGFSPIVEIGLIRPLVSDVGSTGSIFKHQESKQDHYASPDPQQTFQQTTGETHQAQNSPEPQMGPLEQQNLQAFDGHIFAEPDIFTFSRSSTPHRFLPINNQSSNTDQEEEFARKVEEERRFVSFPQNLFD